METIIVVTCLLTLMERVVGAPSLPASVTLCKKNDPELNECVRKSIQESIEAMSHGIPELGVEVLDPLMIDHIDIDKKRNDGRPVDIDLTFKDVSIQGASKATIMSAEADWKNNMVSFNSFFKEPLIMKGKYITDGIILVLPIKGNGEFQVSIEGLKSHIRVHGNTVEKDGAKYMEVDRLAWTFDASHMTISFDNLFQGDKELADTMNEFLNDNWRDIMVEMAPAVEASFSSHFQKMAENIFNRIPIDEIALP